MKPKTDILIVDDVVENIQVAMSILKEDNYNFAFATNAKEALALLERDPSKFDLILLDIMMPGQDGFTTCLQIKDNPLTKDIPIIFLTAKTDIESIKKGFSIGAVDYISKPFHAEELLARAQTHIQLFHSKKLLQLNNIILRNKNEYGYKRLLTELEETQKQMIWVLMELMEATSDETGKHIRRVAELSSLLAHFHPALTDEDAEILLHASPMHDIGKMTVPYEILHKPGKYTEEEFETMKNHTTNAFELLRHNKRQLIQSAAIIAHEHHEKWDGSGYPRQLKGEEIHIYGRIVAIADVFDALTHVRCYKSAWDEKEALKYIKEHRGTQFDPQLVDIMLDNLDSFKLIANMS